MTTPRAEPPQTHVSAFDYDHYVPDAIAHGQLEDESRSESNYSRPSLQQSITTTAAALSESELPSAKAGQQPTRSRTSDYKPTALRWWYHVILIVCLAVLIGLTEYAMRILNIHQDGIDDFVSAQAASKRSNTHNSRAFIHANAQPRSEVVDARTIFGGGVEANSSNIDAGTGSGGMAGSGDYMPLGSLTITIDKDKRRLAASLTNHAQATKVSAQPRDGALIPPEVEAGLPPPRYLDPSFLTIYITQEKRTVTVPSTTDSAQPTGVQVRPRNFDDSANRNQFLVPTEETAIVTENIGWKRTMAASPRAQTPEATGAEVQPFFTLVPAVPAMLESIAWLQPGHETIILDKRDESETDSPSGSAKSTVSRPCYSPKMTYTTMSPPRVIPEVVPRDGSLLESALDNLVSTTVASFSTMAEDRGKRVLLREQPSATGHIDSFDKGSADDSAGEGAYMETGETTYYYRENPRALQTSAADISPSMEENLRVDISATGSTELDGVTKRQPLFDDSELTSSFLGSSSIGGMGDAMKQMPTYLDIGQQTGTETGPNAVRDAKSIKSTDNGEPAERFSGVIQPLPISTEARMLQERGSSPLSSAITSARDTGSPDKHPAHEAYMSSGEVSVEVEEQIKKKRGAQPTSTDKTDTSTPVETPLWEQYISDGMMATLASSPASTSSPSSFTLGPETLLTSGSNGEQASPTSITEWRLTSEHPKHGPFITVSTPTLLSTESSFKVQSQEGKATKSASEATSTNVPFFGPLFSNGATQIPTTQQMSPLQTTVGTDVAPSSSLVILTMNGQITSIITEVDPPSTSTAVSPSLLSNSKAATESGRPLSSSVGSHTSALLTVVPVTVTGGSTSFTSTYTDSQGNIETKTYPVTSSVSRTANATLPLATSTSGLKPDNTTVPHAGIGGGGNVTTSSQVVTVVYGVTLKEYVVGAMLPTVIAVLIAFPIKLIGINARLMQPFHALATSDKTGGSRPEASIFLRFYAWSGLTSFLRAIWIGQPIIAISDLLVLGSGLLAPLAAETITIYEAIDTCVYECKGNLGSSVVSGRVLQGLLGAMIALLLTLVILLSVRQWKTGVSQNPWSIAGMASLCYDPEMRAIIRTMRPGKESAMLQLLGKSRYGLGDPKDQPDSGSSNGRYGVVVTGRANAPGQSTGATDTCREYWEEPHPVNAKNNKQPFMLLTWWGRCVMLFIFASILIIVVYYQATSGNTGFERFMDSQSYGVKFFFTALGVILGYCMETIFRCVAIMSPYLRLRNEALIAERSIILSPPTNAFYGIWSAYKQRHMFFGFLSFVTLLAELGLPVTLSHVPYSAMETYMTAVVCIWLTTAILGLMIISIIWSFFIKWPHMPVDPRTIAGSLFYVCDSWMLESLEGMSTISKESRNHSVRFMGHKYGYG